jgi:pyridoxal 5'-phosphate synthase pdxS subunit
VEAVRHMRAVIGGMKRIQSMSEDELYVEAKELRAPIGLVREVKRQGRLPVVNFSAGGIATPADASLMMQLGADGNFVGSGIFKSQNPQIMAKAIVEATLHFDKPDVLADVSKGLGDAMPGQEISSLKTRLQERGW